MTIRQGLADGRQYQLITLANGLQLTLISDPKSQRSACAMAVRCGYFDDPAERAGLSHLLEHMLSLGTEPYPRVGSYHKFIDSHGGHHNAWTGTEQSFAISLKSITPTSMTPCVSSAPSFMPPCWNPSGSSGNVRRSMPNTAPSCVMKGGGYLMCTRPAATLTTLLPSLPSATLTLWRAAAAN